MSAPGVYPDMPAATYHADPCDPFSLSRGIAHVLLTGNPRKAFHAHPKLGGKGEIKPSRAMDGGSIVHSLMLGKGADIEVLPTVYGPKHDKAGQPVTDYATKQAQADRDAIREAGRIPILAHQDAGLRACAEAALEQLHTHQDGAGFFAAGRSEVVVIWQEEEFWFRIMVDRLPDDPRASPYDVKVTEMSAAPGEWTRRLQRIYAFQDAFYRRGLRAARGVEPGPMLFPVVEFSEPYCLAVHGAAPSLREIADAEVERAISIWKQCVRRNRWPGYPPFTAWAEASNWQINEAAAQELRDEFMEDYAA